MNATISACGKYRYDLVRSIIQPNHTDRPMLFIMLNPSTADGWVDDRTIRRCKNFAKREGCGQLIVVNLFAFRTPEPRVLAIEPEPIGSGNDLVITRWMTFVKNQGGLIVCAWGAHPIARSRGYDLKESSVGLFDLLCLGKTDDGSPRHPLYLTASAPLVPFP